MSKMNAAALTALALLTLPAQAQDPAEEAAVRWDARAAEHLLNRAGFGAGPDEIARAVEVGHERFVGYLLEGFAPDGEPFYPGDARRPPAELLAGATPEERSRLIAKYRREDEAQMLEFTSWWVERMIDGRHPLRERMVLFWHGHFTSSYREVRNSRAMIAQNELFREHALGSFAELLHAIVRDPAMLQYLDNDANRRGKPNENLARELMELFTLGEGHYTERDVKEAARALTGAWAKGDQFEFRKGRHDGGKKKILGSKDRFDAAGLVDLLLEQPACAEWIAGRLLAYFEGRPPDDARVAEYAEHLRANDWSVASFLQRLFLDPRFFADDVVAARIASPVDYLVGTCRRLGVEPPGRVVALAAGYLGERLMDPPNVQGWPGGEAWITTSRFMARGNFAGVLLGVISLDDIVEEADLELQAALDDGSMAAEGPTSRPTSRPTTGMEETVAADTESMAGMQPAEPAAEERARPPMDRALRELRKFKNRTRRPRIFLAERLARRDVAADEEIVEALVSDLLAVEVSAPSRASTLSLLTAERERAGIEPGELLASRLEAEHVLRRVAHVVLSLPEAHLQ